MSLQMALFYFLWLSVYIYICVCVCVCVSHIFLFFSFIFISWSLITSHIFCICSSVDEHLGWLHVLAIVNTTTMNIGCMYLSELVFIFAR